MDVPKLNSYPAWSTPLSKDLLSRPTDSKRFIRNIQARKAQRIEMVSFPMEIFLLFRHVRKTKGTGTDTDTDSSRLVVQPVHFQP